MSSAETQGNLVRNVIHLRLTFWERVRVLFGASVTVFSQTMVEHSPGSAVSLGAWIEFDNINPTHDVYSTGRVAYCNDAKSLPKDRA